MMPILPTSTDRTRSGWAALSRSSLALCALLIAGCQVAEAQLLEPSVPPAAAAAAAPPAEKPDKPPPSWTDARVIAELEKSCAFDPDKLSSDERAAWFKPGHSSAMSCQGELDQSCVYDPCYIKEERSCKPRCVSQCKSCGAACATTCETCKQTCKGQGKSPSDEAACRLGCATSCGACHQTCVRSRDRCSTGTCSSEYRACRSKLKAEWQGNGCPEVCRVYLSCQRPCLRKHEKKGDGWEACTKPCYPPKDQRNGCDLLLCSGSEFSMGIDPADWRR
jgi:hypothetical protein